MVTTESEINRPTSEIANTTYRHWQLLTPPAAPPTYPPPIPIVRLPSETTGVVMLADPQRSHKLPCDLAGGHPNVNFVRDTEGNTLTRQNPLAVVVIPIAVQRKTSTSSLGGMVHVQRNHHPC